MKYSIGERVCFYDKGERFVGNIKYCHKDNTYNIETRFCLFVVHEKQMRKLKPKKKAREFWISDKKSYGLLHNSIPFPVEHDDRNALRIVLAVKPSDPENYIHVKECKK